MEAKSRTRLEGATSTGLAAHPHAAHITSDHVPSPLPGLPARHPPVKSSEPSRRAHVSGSAGFAPSPA